MWGEVAALEFFGAPVKTYTITEFLYGSSGSSSYFYENVPSA